MLAFAANSLLCRAALDGAHIDAATFTTTRVISGALTLGIIMLPHWRNQERSVVNWRSATMLSGYMIFFSFAYISLSAGTGAIILFGAVQLTMFLVALWEGERFPLLSWFGLLLAVVGLIYLVLPGVTAPDPVSAILMAVAGISWGAYSLLGRGETNPLEATANNFIYSVPVVLFVSLLFLSDYYSSLYGMLLAVASGVLASGLGYAIWYAALRGLTATRAATVQLSVPVIAAFGGVILLSERITLRLLLASALILGGIAIVLAQRTQKTS